ncbi:hypothetical protein D0T53_10650 [Dysgonomonas sp. 216]|uniref:chitobiase/beta-hexosaminidase C-terminal domain-containing protein n=1 Tax=Dysgonomonas sp. 216 TaxID=2302934 RepID=UPI0021035C00|nr:chitobiase/beta-hexosaminidase C-terminal domain-containing protein [Dysgonomonas sp. 216]NDW19367.1 hypothetical protein [Dysgonomonas sp. 216]
MFRKILLCFCFYLNILYSYGQVRINEFMQSNIDCIMDDLYEFPDSWVELYNQSDQDINIDGWHISLKKNYTKGWRLSGNTNIPAKGYLLIYCDKVGKGLHTNFRLETTKESNIYLFNEQGALVDKVEGIPEQPNPNISMGITSDNSLKYFIYSTPGKENSECAATKLTQAPKFSKKAGVYNSAIELELADEQSVPNSKIYYTLDGSEPNSESDIYTTPLIIEKSTVVRAKIIADGYLIPRATINTYIISDRDIALPIVSLSLDNKYLWDDMIGIYTEGHNGRAGCGSDEKFNYFQDWRRPVFFEYFPNQESEKVLSQLGELRIGGNCSRSNSIKTFIVYSNKRFGTKHFSYPFFQNDDKRDVIIKSFMLRNAGNDFSAGYLNDAWVQSMMAGKVDIDYQAYQPTVIFVNGEYWGIINIRERSEEDFVYGNYKELENIDMIENWTELKVGDIEAYNVLMSGRLIRDIKTSHKTELISLFKKGVYIIKMSNKYYKETRKIIL